MEDTMNEHWRDVAEDRKYKSNIYSLRWNVYTQDIEELIKIYFLVSVPHPKGRNIVWTCVKDSITKEKEDCKDIGLCGFDYKLFEEEEGEVI